MLFGNWQRTLRSAALYGLIVGAIFQSWVKGVIAVVLFVLISIVLENKLTVRFYHWLKSCQLATRLVVATMVGTLVAIIIFAISNSWTSSLLAGLLLLVYLVDVGRRPASPTPSTRS